MTLSLLSGLTVAVLNLLLAPTLPAADAPRPTPQPARATWCRWLLKLPERRIQRHAPNDLQTNSYTEPYDPNKLRPLMMVPPGLKNLAPGSKMTCSDTNITAETLAKLTDGDKDAYDESIIFLRRGTQ